MVYFLDILYIWVLLFTYIHLLTYIGKYIFISNSLSLIYIKYSKIWIIVYGQYFLFNYIIIYIFLVIKTWIQRLCFIQWIKLSFLIKLFIRHKKKWIKKNRTLLVLFLMISLLLEKRKIFPNCNYKSTSILVSSALTFVLSSFAHFNSKSSWPKPKATIKA